MLGRIRLSKVGIWIGLALTAVGFWAYAQGNSTLNLAGFFYGLPLLLGGLALKSSELEPVPLNPPTPPAIMSLREQQATTTQTKLRKDVTRYRYGQDAHLDEALKYLGLIPQDEDDIPMLRAIREEARKLLSDDDCEAIAPEDPAAAYTLVLEFDSPYVAFSTWQDRLEKMNRYFGPDIVVQLTQKRSNQMLPNPEQSGKIEPTQALAVEVALIRSTTPATPVTAPA